MITVNKKSLNWFVSNLENKTPFAFARYGDGEFQCILGKHGRTCDGQVYTPALVEELKQTLLQAYPYIHAIGPMAVRTLGDEIKLWLELNRVNIQWYDTEVLLQASIDGALRPLVEALKRRKLIYVGPQHIVALMEYLPGMTLRVSQPSTAYESVVALEQFVLTHARADSVVGFSCGPAAKVLIHRLYPLLPDATLIDFGSLWDGYCGKPSRSYMARYNWHKLTALNLGEKHHARQTA